MKRMLYKAYAYFGMPALAVHELWHMLFLFLTRTRIRSFKYFWTDTTFTFAIVKDPSKNRFEEALISLSPILTHIITFILCFFTPVAWFLMAYLIVCYGSFPSKNDIANTFLFKMKKTAYESMKDEGYSVELFTKI